MFPTPSAPGTSVMGIRFHCPNGHKLHVKAFQAGKKGVCPDCGSRFRIPLESERESSKSRKGPSENGEGAGHSGHASPGQDAEHEPAETQIKVEDETEGGSRIGSSQAATSSTRATDPISEAPDAVWYVRPVTGGQFGPARGDVMRKWIAEGRVSPDSLVWREGWADWKSAEEVLPQLARPQPVVPAAVTQQAGALAVPMVSPTAATASIAISTGVPTVGGISAAPASIARLQPATRSNHKFGVIVVISLAAVAVLLVIALIYVLMK